ncbi:MAG: hypothetical protein JWM95_2427, partial [Gemmatimonadetes bacterium]|nr:hypothetical protein [Gemmatimonadota bacterium]
MGEIRKILHFYPFAHFDTGSPKALASFIDATDRSRFQPVFLTSRNGPLVDALAARRVEIVAAKVAGVEVRHPLRGLAQVARMIRRLRVLRPA